MKIAVIGGGIAGLAATWLLQDHHDVRLYEAAATVGGHAHTALLRDGDRTVPVDTAFVIFNTDTYPTFTRLLKHLGVESRPAPTSFSCHIADEGVGYVYGRRRFRAKASDWLKPSFRRMVFDTLRFYRRAATILDTAPAGDGLTIGQYLEQEGYSREFTDHVLLPVASALWSLPLAACHQLEIDAFMSSFVDARFVSIGNRHRWRTIVGGSREYVTRLSRLFADRIRLNTPVNAVSRDNAGVRVVDGSGAEDRFDYVVFACHADASLRLLTDATEAERRVLSRFTYFPNEIDVHHDPSLMPNERSRWATWNYFACGADRSRPVAHTYWMNKLQAIDQRFPTFVSLNRHRLPARDLIEQRFRYDHPTLDPATVKGQRDIAQIQGVARAWFCGSCFERGGSHEDALQTGIRVAEAFGGLVPWK
jgi:predicted NAD/FAD-binding protein